MRLNLRNEKSKPNFRTILGMLCLVFVSMSVSTKRHSRSVHKIEPKDRNLMQFSSPLMNTFSNYMQRAKVENVKEDTPLKKEVNEMNQTIAKAKQKGLKNFLHKKSKKRSLKKKKKIGNPFLEDIKKYVGEDAPSIQNMQLTQNQTAPAQIQVNSPVATTENNIVISQDQEINNRELNDERETQSPQETSQASNPENLNELEEIRKEKEVLDTEEKSIKSEEARLRGEEDQLKKEKDLMGKAEQELKLEENNFNQAKTQEFEKMNQFNQDISTKEQYLSTENQKLEENEALVHQKLAELTKKIHDVETKQHEFEHKMQELQSQRQEISHQKEELDQEREEIENSKHISEEELNTAKKEQANIDHENEDLQNRVQEVKSMRNQLHDLKDAYTVAFHKVVVHENMLKTREKMLQVAESDMARQKADLAQKLIQFKNEYALLRSREQVVSVRMGDIVRKEDYFKNKKEKRKLQTADTPETILTKQESIQLQDDQQNFPPMQQQSLSKNVNFMKQIPNEINALNNKGIPQMPIVQNMNPMYNAPIPSIRGFKNMRYPSLSAYKNMPMPNFGNKAAPTQKIFGGDSNGNNGMVFQPSKNLTNMMDRPKFLDDPYMKKKNFFKDEKLLI